MRRRRKQSIRVSPNRSSKSRPSLYRRTLSRSWETPQTASTMTRRLVLRRKVAPLLSHRLVCMATHTSELHVAASCRFLLLLTTEWMPLSCEPTSTIEPKSTRHRKLSNRVPMSNAWRPGHVNIHPLTTCSTPTWQRMSSHRTTSVTP
jgi:hypothetical protein